MAGSSQAGAPQHQKTCNHFRYGMLTFTEYTIWLAHGNIFKPSGFFALVSHVTGLLIGRDGAVNCESCLPYVAASHDTDHTAVP